MNIIFRTLFALSLSFSMFACAAEESVKEEKATEKVKTEEPKETEPKKEEVATVQEKVPVDRTNIEGFWREFKQLIKFKDEEGLKPLFSADHEGIRSGLYKIEEYAVKIAASTHEDVKKSSQEYKGTEVYEFMMVFPPESPEEGQEESATTIFLNKNDKGEFQIFSVIEAG